MNRGDRREKIFNNDHDRLRFLKTLAEACENTGWQLHAYCLMSNHFHLVVETPQPNLVSGIPGSLTIRNLRRNCWLRCVDGYMPGGPPLFAYVGPRLTGLP
jgi:REP element-mobilizing transposase RayT